jgi:hypothetical protein
LVAPTSRSQQELAPAPHSHRGLKQKAVVGSQGSEIGRRVRSKTTGTNHGQSRDLRNDQWESASLVMRPPGGARRLVRGSEKPCGPAVSPGGNGEENLPRLLAWLRRWTASQCRADSTQRGGQGKIPLGERHASQRGAGKTPTRGPKRLRRPPPGRILHNQERPAPLDQPEHQVPPGESNPSAGHTAFERSNAAARPCACSRAARVLNAKRSSYSYSDSYSERRRFGRCPVREYEKDED